MKAVCDGAGSNGDPEPGGDGRVGGWTLFGRPDVSPKCASCWPWTSSTPASAFASELSTNTTEALDTGIQCQRHSRWDAGASTPASDAGYDIRSFSWGFGFTVGSGGAEQTGDQAAGFGGY